MADEEELEPYADQVPVEGWWVGTSDDLARTVSVTGPEDYSDNYAYTNVEEVHRAPHIVAVDARAMAESIRADLELNTDALGQLEADLQANATELANLDTALANNGLALAQLEEDLGATRTDLQAAQLAADKGIADAATAKAEADAAMASASAAQATADDAAADLLILSGRTGRVIRGTSAPTGTDRSGNNLWLNTSTGQLHEWTGSAWVPITDSRLTDAAARANQAYSLADQAKTQAASAATAASNAQEQADTATGLAESAQADATAAQSIASSAQSAASAAAAYAAAAQGDADQALADAAAAAGIATQVGAKAISRGTDLVTNGTGLMRDNTNFSWATFTPDAPVGASGSFAVSSTYDATLRSDEFIPVDVAKSYTQSVQAKQLVPGVASRAYFGLAPHDAQQQVISPPNYIYQARTMTTLAAPLNPGGTTVTLTAVPSGNEWTRIPEYKYLGLWNWADPSGRVWPQATYTRNVVAFASVSGNVVTLTAPYSGPALPAGTPVSRNYPGNVYMYTTISNSVIPETWTRYVSPQPITGVANGERETISGSLYQFPPGTAFVRLVWLANLSVRGGTQAFASISLSDASAAQAAADAAAGVASSKADVLIQSTAPATSMRKATTLWIDTTSGANTPKQWIGSAWVEVTDKAAKDAAAAAVAAQGTADQAVLDAQAAKDVADVAAANALQALSDADDAMSRATTADGRVTVASANPTAGDGSGKPVGALWYTRSGTGYASIWEWRGTSWEQTTIGTGGISAGAITEAKIATGAISDGKLAQAVKDSISGAASAAALAQQTAGSAQSAAAAAASAAAAAQGDADAAQAAADDAAADLLALSGRTGRVIRGTSAPTGTDRSGNNLWLNTSTGQLHEWNGSTWAVITDSRLTAAAGAADQAANLANAAQDQADTAVSLANAAQDQADTATSAASAAQAAATAAQSTASSAQSAASAAAADAAAAQGDADQAIADAALAKSTADQAVANALAAQNAADTAGGKATTASGKFTVATANPTTGDASGKPIGAVWEVTSGSTVLRRFVLTGATTWTQVKAGQDFIGADAIGSAQISDAAVGTAEIADAAITNAKIGSLAVAGANIADAAITNAKIADLAVTNAKIANLAVETAKIKDGAIVAAKIGDAQITTAKIANLAVDTAKIADAAITNAKIGSLAVGTAQIADAAITNAKVGDLDAGKITAGTLNANRIGAGSITTGKIAAGAVTTTEIATNAVTADKILARSISAGKIATDTITANELASGSVTTAELQAGAVTSAKVTADAGWFTKLSALSAEFNAAFADKITANVISSGTLSGVEMYSPSPMALPRLKIGGSVLEVLRDDGDGTAASTFKLGGSTADEVVLYGADGQPMSGFTAEGNAMVDKELSVGSLRIGGDRIEDLVQSASPEIISYWETTWTPPQIGGQPYGLTRFIFDMEAGYMYELVLDINLIGTANDVATLAIRYATGNVSASSYALDRTRFVFPAANVTSQGSRFVYRRVFGARSMSQVTNSYSGPMQIMPTLQNVSTSTRPITLYANSTDPVVNSGYIKRLGPINWHWASSDSGGGEPFSGTADPTPAPSTKQYTKTYNATSISSYRGGSPITSELGHGTYSGIPRYSSIIFPAQVKTDLTGATNIKVELYLENIHAYYGSGMTVRVGRTGDASHVYRTSGTSPTAVSWGRLDKKWVTLPSGFFTSSHQCIYLGEGASGNGEYGKFRYATSACKLRITYTK